MLVLCCLVDMEATYAEYEEWSDSGVSENVISQYKKASQQMEKCRPFEESLVPDLHWLSNILLTVFFLYYFK